MVKIFLKRRVSGSDDGIHIEAYGPGEQMVSEKLAKVFVEQMGIATYIVEQKVIEPVYEKKVLNTKVETKGVKRTYK